VTPPKTANPATKAAVNPKGASRAVAKGKSKPKARAKDVTVKSAMKRAKMVLNNSDSTIRQAHGTR
jgi:hypothetical protein